MSKVRELSFADFKKEVLEEKERPVLVKYWAPWCMSCKALSSKIDALAMNYPHVKFVSLDVSSERDGAGGGTAADVTSVPTITIFRAGKPTATFAGVVDTKKIQEALLAALRG